MDLVKQSNIHSEKDSCKSEEKKCVKCSEDEDDSIIFYENDFYLTEEIRCMECNAVIRTKTHRIQ